MCRASFVSHSVDFENKYIFRQDFNMTPVEKLNSLHTSPRLSVEGIKLTQSMES